VFGAVPRLHRLALGLEASKRHPWKTHTLSTVLAWRHRAVCCPVNLACSGPNRPSCCPPTCNARSCSCMELMSCVLALMAALLLTADRLPPELRPKGAGGKGCASAPRSLQPTSPSSQRDECAACCSNTGSVVNAAKPATAPSAGATIVVGGSAEANDAVDAAVKYGTSTGNDPKASSVKGKVDSKPVMQPSLSGLLEAVSGKLLAGQQSGLLFVLHARSGSMSAQLLSILDMKPLRQYSSCIFAVQPRGASAGAVPSLSYY
jgi:hypothetical protein